MHTPVLLQEVIEALDVKSDGKYIDATVGEGGHLRELIKKGAHVLAVDWDAQQIQNLKSKVQSKNVSFATGNFRQLEKIAKKCKFFPVDGILMDLGLSMHQITSGKRGFSYKNLDEPLDMRMSIKTITRASDIVNIMTEQDISEILARNSEELFADIIAETIVRQRVHHRINRVGDLLNAIDNALKSKNIVNQFERNKVYSRVFQALRIAVNSEFDNLRQGLKQGMKLLKSGGKLAVITFHSREDRIVKQFVRDNNLKTTTKKAVVGDRELSFERSAKLRVIEK